MDKETINRIASFIGKVIDQGAFGYLDHEIIPPLLKRILSGELVIKNADVLVCDTCGEIAFDLTKPRKGQFTIIAPSDGSITCEKCWVASGDCVGE